VVYTGRQLGCTGSVGNRSWSKYTIDANGMVPPNISVPNSARERIHSRLGGGSMCACPKCVAPGWMGVAETLIMMLLVLLFLASARYGNAAVDMLKVPAASIANTVINPFGDRSLACVPKSSPPQR
jgi:hypothetical protein